MIIELSFLFVAGMVSNKQVSTLEMGLNAIGDRSAKSIANMLLQNDTLRGLSLFKNSMLTAGVRVSDSVVLTSLSAKAHSS